MAAAVVLVASTAQVAAGQGPVPSNPARPPGAAISPDTVSGKPARLERADLEAWLDGFMPFTLAASNIAGGVVVVVRDGDAKPITLRNIMTHTPGFEESIRYLIGDDSTKLIPLERLMKIAVPKRVFAPGTTPAYSNYATALAGYIVARVSGQSFDQRVEQKIFQPLGMTRSSFRQPLPAPLKPLLSQGYALASC
jgi:hypothetical protein